MRGDPASATPFEPGNDGLPLSFEKETIFAIGNQQTLLFIANLDLGNDIRSNICRVVSIPNSELKQITSAASGATLSDHGYMRQHPGAKLLRCQSTKVVDWVTSKCAAIHWSIQFRSEESVARVSALQSAEAAAKKPAHPVLSPIEIAELARKNKEIDLARRVEAIGEGW